MDQNANTHSPQNGRNDSQNSPTIKTENKIDVIGNENEAEDEDENYHEDLEEAPTNNYSIAADSNYAMDPDTV